MHVPGGLLLEAAQPNEDALDTIRSEDGTETVHSYTSSYCAGESTSYVALGEEPCVNTISAPQKLTLITALSLIVISHLLKCGGP